MKRSLSTILTVIGSLFIALLGTWFYLHTKAQTKPIKPPFEHPFLNAAHRDGRTLLIFRVEKPVDVPDATKTESTKHSLALWLDVRLAGENQLVVSRDDLLQTGPAKGKPIEIASRAECLEAGLSELADFYPALQNRLVILNLISRRPGLSQKILEVWGPVNAPSSTEDKPLPLASVAIQSEGDGNLKELREARPAGLFGSSQATLIQIEVLSNIGLQGLMDLKSDVLISVIEESLRDGQIGPRVRNSTLIEAHRRGLKRYAGPTRTKDVAQKLFDDGYDGVLVERRDVLDSLLL